MRIGEAFAVCWGDVNFETAKLSIARQIQWDAGEQLWYFTNPKYDSARVIDIDDELLGLLARERERQMRARAYYGDGYTCLYVDERGYVNSEGRGTEINMIAVREDGSLIAPRVMQHTSAIIHKQLGIPEFDFHSLRHTHVTMLMDGKAPVKYVQERVGHKKIEITINVYQHMSEVAAQQGISVLNGVLEAAGK